MKHHESLPYALNRIAKELEVQASRIPNRMKGNINKLLQDSAYLRQAAKALTDEKNVSDKHLKKQVSELMQAIGAINDDENYATKKLGVELFDILKELIERKKLTKSERIKHEKNQRVLISQVLMDILFEENDEKTKDNPEPD